MSGFCSRSAGARRRAMVAAVVLVAAFAVVCTMGAALPKPAHASAVVLPSGSVGDVVVDDARGLVYMSDGGLIQRYDPVTGTFLRPFSAGQTLQGMDISPDGKTLAVASAGTYWLYLVDLDTGKVAPVYIAPDVLETGGWTVAWTADQKVLFTTSYGGSGWIGLRRIDPATGTVTYLTNSWALPNWTVVSASGDRSVIGFGQQYGWWGYYRSSDGNVTGGSWTGATGVWGIDVAVNRNGSQFAFPGMAATTVQTQGYATLATLGGAMGAKFSPTADVLYLAGIATDTVTAYDTSDYHVLATYHVAPTISSFNVRGMQWSRMSISADNGLLAEKVAGGVAVARLRPAIRGVVRSSERGRGASGVQVEIWRRHAGTWTLDATTTTSPSGSWTYTTLDDSPVHARVNDTSGAFDPAWIGGDDVASAADLLPNSEMPATPASVTVHLARPGTIAGHLSRTWDGGPSADVRVTLYDDMNPSLAPVTATSDASGSYQFSGLTPTLYRIGFSSNAGEYPSSFWDGRQNVDAAMPVVVSAGATTTVNESLTFVPLILHGVAHSTFRGLPIANAQVELWADHAGTPTRVATITADTQGSWAYQTSSPDALRVRLTDPLGMHDPVWIGGNAFDSASAFVPTRTGGGTSADIAMPLTDGGTISGIVRSSNGGVPLSGVTVTAYLDAAGFPVVENAVTMADGSYSLPGLGAASFKLGFVDPLGAHVAKFYDNATSVGAGADLTVSEPGIVAANTTLSYIPLGITGKVTSSYRGAPVPGAIVEIWRQNAGVWSIDTTFGVAPDGTWNYTTDSTDAVHIHVVDTNGANDPAWVGSGTSAATASDVLPARSTPTHADAVLQMVRPGSIAGHIWSSLGHSSVPGAKVTLYVDDAGSATALATTTAGSDGSYHFDAVGPSSYFVGVSDPTGANAPVAPTEPISVVGSGTIGFDATMQFVPLSLQGHVTSTFHGAPVPDAIVQVWQRNGQGAWALKGSTTADENGAWIFSTDSTSPARVLVSDTSLMNDPAWYGGGSDVAHAADVVPARGVATVADVSLALVRPATLVGFATDDYFSIPATGTQVALCMAGAGPTVVATTTVAADGSFEFDGVGLGNYCVYLFDSQNLYAPQWWDQADSYADATVITIDSPGLLGIDAYMQRYQVQHLAQFTDDVASPIGPYVGDEFEMLSTLVDSLWGDGLDGMPVVVQSSTDGQTWTTVTNAVIQDEGGGEYWAQVPTSDATRRLYRFSVGPTPDIVAVTSIPHVITPQLKPAVWGAIKTYTMSPLSSYGYNGRLSAVLTDGAGSRLSTQARLEGSNDGVNWTTVAGTSEMFDGDYNAWTPVPCPQYLRFRVAENGRITPASSALVSVPGRWTFSVTGSNRAKAGRALTLRGSVGCLLIQGPGVSVTVQTKKKKGRKFVTVATKKVRVAGTVSRMGSFKFTTKLSKGLYQFLFTVPTQGPREKTILTYAMTVH